MWYKTGRFLSWLIFRLCCGLSVKGKENLPKNGGFILASNHLSNLDPFVLGAAADPVELNFMAKEELFRNPLANWWLRKVNAFPLKRKGADISAIKTAIKRVKDGGALLIFPEGGRSADGNMHEAHQGIGFLAEKTGCPIVPAFISGTNKALPKGSVFIRPAKISVRFGKQIFLERRVAYSDVADKVMQAIKQLSCSESS